jgi:hypothetical protein
MPASISAVGLRLRARPRDLISTVLREVEEQEERVAVQVRLTRLRSTLKKSGTASRCRHSPAKVSSIRLHSSPAPLALSFAAHIVCPTAYPVRCYAHVSSGSRS